MPWQAPMGPGRDLTELQQAVLWYVSEGWLIRGKPEGSRYAWFRRKPGETQDIPMKLGPKTIESLVNRKLLIPGPNHKPPKISVYQAADEGTKKLQTYERLYGPRERIAKVEQLG